MIEDFNLSKYNDSCLEVIDKSMTGKYHLVSGLSSYALTKEFLFAEEIKPLMIKIQKSINGYIRSYDNLEETVISSSWFNI